MDSKEAESIAITIDTEWAHPTVLADLVGLIEDYEVAATLFCTGPVEASSDHELAIHPNFRRSGDLVRDVLSDAVTDMSKLDDGFVYRMVLAKMRAMFPDAIGSRSHSLIYDSALVPELSAAGFRYDSTYMASLHPVEPFLKEYGVLEIPIYYMDHIDLMTGETGFRLDGLKLGQPGLKVFDFHPNMVFIDARSNAQYLESKAHYHDPDALLALRSDGGGVRGLLIALLDYVRSEGVSTVTLKYVCAAETGTIHRATQ